MNANEDIDNGRRVMVYFHNRALNYPQNYSMEFEALISELNRRSPAFLEGFGFAVAQVGMSEDRVKRTLEGVADEGQGRLPANLMDFFNRLSNEATTIHFLDAVKATAAGTAQDLAKGAQQVGQGVISGLKWLPYVAVAAVLLFAFEKGRAAL